jgi:hypothetical protein
MASNVTIKDSRTEWDNLTRRVKEVRRGRVPSVKIGVFANKQGSDLVTYASANEFGVTRNVVNIGTGTTKSEIRIPERSYLRSAVAENKKEINEFVSARFSDFLDGKTSVPRALKRIGLFATKLVKKKIREGPFVPNALSTILRKGSSKPLIDTGRLRQSITHEIDR